MTTMNSTATSMLRSLFELDEPLIEAIEVSENHHFVVPTPLGDEIVYGPECDDEPTQVYTADQLKALLGHTCPHRHETVRAMMAVRAA